MKKILIFLAIAILCGGARMQAAPVSPERALRVAQQLLPATRAAGELRIVWDGELATKAAEPAFYVVAGDRGFVIVAGDDNVPPVLALSRDDRFEVEGMPANVRWWMEEMKAYVRAARNPEPQALEQWLALEGTKATAAVDGVTDTFERLTPKWNQGNSDKARFGRNVFNALCPLDGTERSVTGCVATAMAEVLTYQSGQPGVTMPSSASGTVGGYTVESGYYRPDTYALGVTYDWANLRTLTDAAAIETVVNAGTVDGNALLENLAQLMLDMGAMVEAIYSSEGTGANTGDIPAALALHMGFNKAASYEAASDYSARQWSDRLKAEIDQRPLIYNGRDPDKGGHAFVFDGYGMLGTERVFHVNFGWGGSCNGYYRLTNLDTDGGGNYVNQCGAIFGLYPAPDSTYPVRLAWGSYAGYDGFQADHRIAAGEDFNLSFCIENKGNAAYSGSVKFVLEDKNGTQKSVLRQMGGISIGVGSMTYYYGIGSFNIAAPVFGDRIVCYATTTDASTWEAVPTAVHGTVVPEVPVMPRAFIATAASYNRGDWFTLRLMNQDYLYAGTQWTFTAPSGGSETVPQSAFEYQLGESGTWKVSAEVKPTVGGDTVETIVAFITVN